MDKSEAGKTVYTALKAIDSLKVWAIHANLCDNKTIQKAHWEKHLSSGSRKVKSLTKQNAYAIREIQKGIVCLN